MRLKDDSGMCLTELMIAMVTGLVVLSATIQMLDHFQQRLWRQHDAMGLHQDQRIGMRIFEEELRMAGTIRTDSHGSLVRAEQQEIEFDANIAGLTTTLTQPVVPSATELQVADGSTWDRGKRIVICSGDHCAESRLSQDGQARSLDLAVPISEAFPRGSEIMISNRVRYYMGKGRNGKASLMRQVDGGANSIIGDVTFFSLAYVDRAGKPTTDPSSVVRVRVQLTVGRDQRTVISEIGLRAI